MNRSNSIHNFNTWHVQNKMKKEKLSLDQKANERLSSHYDNLKKTVKVTVPPIEKKENKNNLSRLQKNQINHLLKQKDVNKLELMHSVSLQNKSDQRLKNNYIKKIKNMEYQSNLLEDEKVPKALQLSHIRQSSLETYKKHH